MYLSGIKSTIVGCIKSLSPITIVENKKVINVVLTFTEGYNQKRVLKNVECSFWGNDADSIAKYPENHPIMAEGILTAEAYTNKDSVPAVKLKLNIVSWRSLKKLENNSASASASKPNEVTTKGTDKRQSQNTSVESKVSVSNEDEFLKKSLDAVLTFGPYKAMRVKEVLEKDYKYVYEMAEKCSNAKWKQVFTIAYNHFYKSQQKKQTNTIPGNSTKFVSKDYTDMSDEDLPF